MYIRWKKRKWKDGRGILDAVLVKSCRDGTKVKQQFIKNLGYISTEISHEDLKYGIAEHRFIENVKYHLERSDLDLSQREKIEGMARKKFGETHKCSAY